MDCGGTIGDQNILELVRAGWQYGGALVDLGEIKEFKDRQVLDGGDFVHPVKAKAALAVEEIGDMGLLESGQLGKSKAGKFPGVDAFPQDFTEIIL